MCDILLAGEEAKFAQSEVKIGIIPGMTGSQRLTRSIGKSRAMELILTGEMMGAHEAASRGLVSRVVPSEAVVDEALEIGKKIALKSQPCIFMAKEAVNFAFESTLKEGVLFERHLFQSTFATKDQKEGMAAFAEKRKPNWTHL